MMLYFVWSILLNFVLFVTCFLKKEFLEFTWLILLKFLKKLYESRLAMSIAKRIKSMNERSEIDPDVVKMFEFKRVRPSNLKSDNNEARGREVGSLIGDLSYGDDIDTSKRVYYQLPTARSGHRAVCDEHNLWIWGGYCPHNYSSDEDLGNSDLDTNPMLSELYRFNFSTRKWILLKTSGEAPKDTVASHSLLLHRNLLIVFGGTGYPFGEKLGESLYICNLKTLEWKEYEIKGDRPIPSYGNSMVFQDNYLYILFGTNSITYFSNVYKIDIRTMISEKLFDSLELVESANFTTLRQLNAEYPNDFLAGRYRQEVVVHEEKIYVFGGGKSDGDSIDLIELPVFDLNKQKWEFLKTQPDSNNNEYPQKRKFHSCIKINGFVYVIGGMYCNVSEHIFQQVENCVWRLDLEEMKWEKLDIKLPLNTYFHASCVNETGQVFLHGGVRSKGTDNKRINHLYTIYLQIPKLSHLCWNMIINNYPKLLKTPKKDLSDAGFPANWLN